MYSCQRAVHIAVLLCILALHTAHATSSDASATTTTSKPAVSAIEDSEKKLVVITEDVIPDVENTTQKVIRVNPLDLPAITADHSGNTDSSLYNIQSLLPANRNYVNSNSMRRIKTRSKNSVADDAGGDSPIIRQITEPKFRKPSHNQQKKLHFFYNQNSLDGRQAVSKTMPVRVAPGAYPVYYTVSKTNGRFGKYPIKGFRSPTDFLKYLAKTKVASLDSEQRLES